MSNSSTYKTVHLPLEMICSQVVLPRLKELGLGSRWEVSTQADYMTDAIVANIRGYFLSQPLIDTIDIAYPKDWKEALKERFAPKWFLKKYPVVYVKHYAKVAELYPDYVVPKDFGRVIKIAEHRSWEQRGKWDDD